MNAVFYVQMALWFAGYTVTIKLSEIFTAFVALSGLGLATQAVREGMTVSREAQAASQVYSANVVALRYTKFSLTNGSVISGTDALVYFTRSCKGEEVTAGALLVTVTQATSLAYCNAQNTPPAGKRRSSSIAAEIAQIDAAFHSSDVEDKSHDIMKKKYNPFSVDGVGKILSWSLGFAFLTIPTVVGKLRGETTMVDSNATQADIVVDILTIIVLLLGVMSVSLLVLASALSELGIVNSWTRFLVGSICEGTGWRHRPNEVLDFHLRLDCPEAVESFEVLYDLVRAVSYSYGEYHKKPFGLLMMICVASVVAVFVGSVMELEIDTWNVLLFVMGGGVLIVSMRVFLLIVVMHGRLGATMMKMLRHQRRLNNDAIERLEKMEAAPQVAEARVQVLMAANKKILRLLEVIADVHRPLVLFGAVPLTKENVVKASVAMAAALFTTVLRTSINM
jgi:hypothetical protein